jgi:putative effector of murein hydrolase LrgA (UPF0299 family)
MPAALATLVGLQLLGEVLRVTLHLPMPGALIGMFLLAVVLVWRGSAGEAGETAVPAGLLTAARVLIANMGLLFVPAGVGVMAEMGLLRQAWLPIVAGLVVSTVLGLGVTGLVMHHVSRAAAGRRPVAAE